MINDPVDLSCPLVSRVLFGSEVVVCGGRFGQGRKIKKSKLLTEIFARCILGVLFLLPLAKTSYHGKRFC